MHRLAGALGGPPPSPSPRPASCPNTARISYDNKTLSSLQRLLPVGTLPRNIHQRSDNVPTNVPTAIIHNLPYILV